MTGRGDAPSPGSHRIGALIDGVLEVPVVPSFSRIGYEVRSRVDHWTALDGSDLSGRVVAITGPTSGLGRATAGLLARAGATLVLLGRDRDRTERVRAELHEEVGADRATVVLADMGDLASVRTAAGEILAAHPRLDALVHNAGTLDAARRVTADGIESTIAVQVAGPFLLTGLLFPRLRASAPSRVVTVSSGGMYATGLDVDHLEMGDDYKGSEQYARAKRAQVTLNGLWAERTVGSGVAFHAMHPGWADTPGVAASLPRFKKLMGPLLRTPDQGADTIAWLVADDGEPATTSGSFWLDRRTRPLHKLPSTRRTDTPAERARLWDWCVARTGLDPLA